MNIIVHVFWSYSANRFCLNLQEKIIKNRNDFNEKYRWLMGVDEHCMYKLYFWRESCSGFKSSNSTIELLLPLNIDS